MSWPCLKKLNSPNRTLVVCVGEDDRFTAESIDLALVENEDSEAALKRSLIFWSRLLFWTLNTRFDFFNFLKL